MNELIYNFFLGGIYGAIFIPVVLAVFVLTCATIVGTAYGIMLGVLILYHKYF